MYDLINCKFGKLLVLGYSNKNVCICKCDCGKLILLTETELLNNFVISCGHNEKSKTAKTRLKNIYNNMKSRCYNKNSKSYKYYGGKGIKICDEWLIPKNAFENFYKWSMKNGYKNTLTIDRIDNEKGYSPTNCRWIDLETQNNNRSICHYINYNNKTLTLSQWARECNLNPGVLLQKIKKLGEKEALEVSLKNNNV